MKNTSQKTTKASRRAAQLLAHYSRCAALAASLGVIPAQKINGKRISNALLRLEREANAAATAQCNAEAYGGQPYRPDYDEAGEESDSTPWSAYKQSVKDRIVKILGKLPPGFFFNQDPRGYALKIDTDNAEGAQLVKALGLVTDWGRNGILSPEITGN